MKLAVFSESETDDLVIMRLAGALRPEGVSRVPLPRLRARGWDALLNGVGAVLKHVYFRTDADALAIVADSDNSEVHNLNHGSANVGCRHCILTEKLDRLQQFLPPITGRARLKVAVAVATPSIEAWLLHGTPGAITEQQWIEKRKSGANAYTEIRQLKLNAYGEAGFRSGDVRIARALEHAERLAAHIELLAGGFPNSFKPFRDALAPS
jgi:hypothetical protein